MSMRVVVMKRPRPAALKRLAVALANVRSVVLKSAKAGSVALKRPALSFATAKSVASKSDETESRGGKTPPRYMFKAPETEGTNPLRTRSTATRTAR